MDSFNVFRKDRSETGSLLTRGGGVLIATKINLVADEIELEGTDSIECICLRIQINSSLKCYLYAAYIPPHADADTYKSHLEAVHKIPVQHNDILMVFGDFNIPNSSWVRDGQVSSILLPTSIAPRHCADFIEGLLNKGMVQVNNIYNNMDRLLDLIFTNEFLNVEVIAPHPLSKLDRYHPPVLLSYEWHLEPSFIVSPPRLNFQKADFISINNFLASIDFEREFICKSLDEKITFFYGALLEAIAKFVPSSTTKRNDRYPWWNKRLQALKNKRNKEWKRFRATGFREQFENVMQQFMTLNEQLYGAYATRMKSAIKSNPSMFWRFVNKKRSNENSPKILRLGNTTSTNEKQQANLFVTFFSSNFHCSRSHHLVDRGRNTPEMDQVFLLDEYNVFCELLKINVKKGTGPDGVHPLVLKHCSSLIYKPLTAIFNESLQSGIFPDCWKRSSITPVFKKGTRSNIENYRCIAKLPTIAKFFESLINAKLQSMVKNRIVPNQHGFMRGRSTTTNLMDFTHFALKGIAEGEQVDVLYTDFSKAFDRVNHQLLAEKLYSYNIPQNMLNWITSYLDQRLMYVQYANSVSDDFLVESGVPQGSHLGPTLFLLFINDIIEVAGQNVFISLFADDVKIAKTIRNTADRIVLQEAIDRLKIWCELNELDLNLNKCSVLSLSRRNVIAYNNYHYGAHIFENVKEQKDLGVIMDSKLSFTTHINGICSKANSALGFLKRLCYGSTDINTMKIVYSALVRSHLEYGNIVWLPHHELYNQKIESIQRQFTMFALKEYPHASNNFRISPYETRLSKLDMTSLYRRRINTALIFLHNLLGNRSHSMYLRDDIAIHENTRPLRQSDYLRITNHQLKFLSSAPLNQMCRIANNISKTSNIFRSNLSSNLFKNKLQSIPDHEL